MTNKDKATAKKSKKSTKKSKNNKADIKNKSSQKGKKVSLYKNLVNNRKSKKQRKKELKAKQRKEYLASMPKDPIKRFFWRLHPIRVLKFIFSWRGFFLFVKLGLVCVLIGVLTVVGVFYHYHKEVQNLRPEDISQNIKTTVNKYYDRNGVLLWEDKGSGNYTLAIKEDQVNKYMKEATIAIEDRNFYKHNGVSIRGLSRAVISNLRGGSVQGGSTLTQQLIKQVFFAKEAHKRGINGIPRKIKEMIMAVELERLYTKDQIITMYLNESPYGGRRNGVESGAQTYFGKTTKDLTLEEAALLASIPNQPGLYNPYNIAGNKALITRQRKVLDDMVETGAITRKQAEQAKKVPILDKIKPESTQWNGIKAPHFVLEAKKQAEAKIGLKKVRAGGLKITTTLDYEAQKAAEDAVKAGSAIKGSIGADNIALGSIDVQTGQIIAMVGSIDFTKPGYGEINATLSNLEPGSSIKPIADFAPLFMKRPGINYGPGSILKDENIDSVYCRGSRMPCRVQNYTHKTYGSVPIRKSLAGSLNRPAIKAMYIVGKDKAINIARELGDKSYCVNNKYAGLSSAIGGGCAVKLMEHANAYASIARGGVYKDYSYLLEVKDEHDKELYKWTIQKGKQVIDPQSAYMVTSILSDAKARTMVFGNSGYGYGFVVPKVWTASKTGTTENGRGRAKDSWMMSYSSVIAAGVWVGNHNGAPLTRGSNHVARRTIHNYMRDVHLNVYAKQNKWKVGDKIPQPAGLRRMTFNGVTDIWPSWFNPSRLDKEKVVFDKISKKKATNCTPELAKQLVEAYKYKDPYSNKMVYDAPDGYDYSEEDDIHKCSDKLPSISDLTTTNNGQNNYDFNINVVNGSHPIQEIIVLVNNKEYYKGKNQNINFSYDVSVNSKANIQVIATDDKLYQSKKTFIGPEKILPEESTD